MQKIVIQGIVPLLSIKIFSWALVSSVIKLYPQILNYTAKAVSWQVMDTWSFAVRAHESHLHYKSIINDFPEEASDCWHQLLLGRHATCCLCRRGDSSGPSVFSILNHTHPRLWLTHLGNRTLPSDASRMRTPVKLGTHPGGLYFGRSDDSNNFKR